MRISKSLIFVLTSLQVGLLGNNERVFAQGVESALLYGCINPGVGRLRIIDSESECLENETAIQLVPATDGKVGIGTSTPMAALEVVGDVHATGTIRSGNSITIDGDADIIRATSGSISFDDENLSTAGTVEASSLCIAGECRAEWLPLSTTSDIATNAANIAILAGNDRSHILLIADNTRDIVVLQGQVTALLAHPNPDPPCFDNENRYADCGNGTVTDSVTGLVWLQDANCLGNQDWATANQLAAELAEGQCGLTDGSRRGDWRLPTKAEWEATIAQAIFLDCNSGGTFVALTGTAGRVTPGNPSGCFRDEPVPLFVNVFNGKYWSSSAREEFPRSAWPVHLRRGIFDSDPKFFEIPLWPVRDP